MKKIKVFIIISILIAFSVIFLNYKTDPFNVKEYNTKNKKFVLYHVNRDVDLISLLLRENAKSNKYDYVVVGGSSIVPLYETNYFVDKTKKSIIFLNLEGITPKEHYELLKYYLQLYPETKNIIVSLELNSYFYCAKDKFFKGKHLKIAPYQVFFKLYFSSDSLLKTINKLRKYEKKRREGNNYYEVCTVRKYNYSKTCEYQNVEYLKKIKELVDSKNLNATYIIPPVHALYFANQYQGNTYEKTENLKRMYAQITPFYDMGFMHPYTFLPMNKSFYFKDVVHGTKFLGKEITEVITKKNLSPDFVVYVDNNNVEDVLKQQKQQLMKYIEENKEEVEQYYNHVYEKGIDDQNTEKIYYKDMPEDLKIRYSEFFSNK